MSLPAIKLGGLANGPDPMQPEPGDANTYPLVPLAEPINQGEPPVLPDFVGAAGVAWPIRAVRSRSGHLITHSMDVVARPTWRVKWTGLTAAQRATLRAWLRDDVQMTLCSWALRPDGPESDLVTVRFIGEVTQLFIPRGGSAGPAFNIEEATVEETYT